MTTPERGETDLVIVDTRVWLEGILFGGTAEDLVKMAVIDSVRLVTSERLLDELAGVLSGSLAFSEAAVREVLRFVRDAATVIDDTGEIATGSPLLAAAVRAEATLIATTERSPLARRGEHAGIPIVAVA